MTNVRAIEPTTNALRAPFEVVVDRASSAPPVAVWETLAVLTTHLHWGGDRRPARMRLLTMEAPPGIATTGTEFATTGSDPSGTFADRSVVTEATPGRVFEFVTEATLTPKRGGPSVEWTIVHRYEIASESHGSRVSYRLRIARISRLAGPLRLLRTPAGGVLGTVWRSLARRGLRQLVAVAEAAPTR